MKKILFITALMSGAMFGCSDSPKRTPNERATTLIRERNLSSENIERLDTVYGYEDVFSMRMTALRLKWSADSILLNQRSQKRFLNAKEQEEVSGLSNSILALERDAAKHELQYSFEKKNKEMVGLCYAFADSLTGKIIVVYFDPDVKEIKGISRNIE